MTTSKVAMTFPVALLEHARMLMLRDAHERAMMPDDHLRVVGWLTLLDEEIRHQYCAPASPPKGADPEACTDEVLLDAAIASAMNVEEPRIGCCGGPMANDEVAVCGALAPDGERCQRATYHPGPHIAHDCEGCVVWPASPPKAPDGAVCANSYHGTGCEGRERECYTVRTEGGPVPPKGTPPRLHSHDHIEESGLEMVIPAHHADDLPKEAIVSLTIIEFDALLEYSTTLPTGTTLGKKWKCRRPYRDDGKPPNWYLGEYVEDPDPEFRAKGCVGIVWKKIEVTK